MFFRTYTCITHANYMAGGSSRKTLLRRSTKPDSYRLSTLLLNSPVVGFLREIKKMLLQGTSHNCGEISVFDEESKKPHTAPVRQNSDLKYEKFAEWQFIATNTWLVIRVCSCAGEQVSPCPKGWLRVGVTFFSVFSKTSYCVPPGANRAQFTHSLLRSQPQAKDYPRARA